jgi:hypothetical protein
VVQRLAADAGVPVQVRDVDDPAATTPADRERWTDHVPVVLLDGEQHSMWFVDEPALAKALGGR